MNPYEGRVFQITDELNLAGFTEHGWRLEQILEQQTSVRLEKSPPPGERDTYGNRPPNQFESALAKSHRFLISREAGNLGEKVEELEQQVRKLSSECSFRESEAEKDATKATEKVEKLKKECDTLAGNVDHYRAQWQNLEKAKRKMEEDLAKVRTAVGELRWKELVG